jgi:ribosomal protein L11 methyltransferase
VKAPSLEDPPDGDEALAALLDDFSPAAIEDLALIPLPPGGQWDPTCPPIPDPPPAPIRWRVFFQTAEDRNRAAAALTAAMPSLAVTPVDVDDEDWAARSQRSLTAIRAGRFIVAPPWDLPDQDHALDPLTVIVIEPSMGFGTGHHATTRLCLRLLSDVTVRSLDVLDIGTGSGVLALAASRQGARSVVALDVDHDAIESAQRSAGLNPLPCPVDFRVADFRERGSAEAADLVFANLTAGMLMSSVASLRAAVRPGGTLIVSGFDSSEADGVRAALAALHEEARLEEEDWVAMRLRSG